jgi:hypothetical protein
MLQQELLHLTADGYLLGSSFCKKKNLQRWGMCIFVIKNQRFNITDISHCYEISVFTVKLIFPSNVKSRILKLTHTVNFAARSQNDSSTAIDNIFVA